MSSPRKITVGYQDFRQCLDKGDAVYLGKVLAGKDNWERATSLYELFCDQGSDMARNALQNPSIAKSLGEVGYRNMPSLPVYLYIMLNTMSGTGLSENKVACFYLANMLGQYPLAAAIENKIAERPDDTEVSKGIGELRRFVFLQEDISKKEGKEKVEKCLKLGNQSLLICGLFGEQLMKRPDGFNKRAEWMKKGKKAFEVVSTEEAAEDMGVDLISDDISYYYEGFCAMLMRLRKEHLPDVDHLEKTILDREW